MEALIIGPVVSEFGWELMEWQAHCRAKAKSVLHGNVVVCTTRGREYLYEDFAGLRILHNIHCNRDGHKPRSNRIQNPNELERVTKTLRDWSREYKKKGYNVGWMKSWGPGVSLPKHFEDQEFISYGQILEDNPYKLVVHARNVAVGGPCSGDNYPRGHWAELLAYLFDSGLVEKGEVAAIGIREGALCPDGCVDKRNISLPDTADLLRSAKLVIGPSSGPMHLASLCQTPHFVWATGKFQSLMPQGNDFRYKSQWNPFQTPVDVLIHKKGHRPQPVVLANGIIAFASDVYDRERL